MAACGLVGYYIKCLDLILFVFFVVFFAGKRELYYLDRRITIVLDKVMHARRRST